MSAKETLLLVEDNHDLRNGLRDILTYEGFTVLTAVHGREALAQMEAATPDLIISDITKPGQLSMDEWTEIRQPPMIGAEMLKGVSYLADAVPVILHHHERWDGRGYPAGLMGDDILLEARINRPFYAPTP